MEETFSERLVSVARTIPRGKVTTYGDLARAAGGTGQAARSVTAILGRAYCNGVTDIPFHRIVFSGGKVWTNNEHFTRRMKLFREEGIEVDKKGQIQNFADKLHQF